MFDVTKRLTNCKSLLRYHLIILKHLNKPNCFSSYLVWFSWPLAYGADLSFVEYSVIHEDFHYVVASSTQRLWNHCSHSPPQGHSSGLGCSYRLHPHQSPWLNAFQKANNSRNILSAYYNTSHWRWTGTCGSDLPFWSSLRVLFQWQSADRVIPWGRAPVQWRVAVWQKASWDGESFVMTSWNAMRLAKGMKSWSCWQTKEHKVTCGKYEKIKACGVTEFTLPSHDANCILLVVFVIIRETDHDLSHFLFPLHRMHDLWRRNYRYLRIRQLLRSLEACHITWSGSQTFPRGHMSDCNRNPV